MAKVSALLFLVSLAGSVQAQEQQVLCELGCRCPEDAVQQASEFVDCDRRGISRLPAPLRLGASVLRLSLRGNRLGALQARAFEGRLQELDLGLNALSEVEGGAFAPLRNLTHLRLPHNRLGALGPAFLEGLSELRLLDLGHNALRELSGAAFAHTAQLQELRLQHNPLFRLPEDAFRLLPRLEKLDLQGTGLATLPGGLLAASPRLHWLSLSTNALERVPREALTRAPALEILDLSDNDFSVLGEGAFAGLSNITVLYLNNLNRLTRIENNALAGLVSLKSLSCSYNKKLNYIDPEAFGSSAERTAPKQQLYLRKNSLRTLRPPLDPETWSAMSFVDLGENPWKCDCQLLWMLELNLETQTNIRCTSPPKLQGRTLNTVKPHELSCSGDWAQATIALISASMVAFCLLTLAFVSVVCSRTPGGLYVRAKQQFSYAKVQPKTETVDLEWDPSADA